MGVVGELADRKEDGSEYKYKSQVLVLDKASDEKNEFAATVKLDNRKGDIRFYVAANAVSYSGEGFLQLHASMLKSSSSLESYYRDSVSRSYVVLPNGFPVSSPLGAMLDIKNVEDNRRDLRELDATVSEDQEDIDIEA